MNTTLVTDPVSARAVRFPRGLRLFEPAPAAAPIADPAQVQSSYRVWQRRVLLASIIGYATFYFVRKNLDVAMPVMETSLGISKVDLGLFLTLSGVLYGVSKFINGFLGDRCNARVFMATGLVASAVLNLGFGISSGVLAWGLFWMCNGWFQGMGFPPCARLMTHWFPPKKLATKMSIWNISHSIGASVIFVLCGYLALRSWRLCFFVPAGIALACAVFLWRRLPDTPPSVGLPEVEGTRSRAPADQSDDFRQILFKHVLRNRYVWLLAVANFFVYTVRYAVMDWGPTFLTQAKHIQLTHAAWMVSAYELSGLSGMLLAGWMTDKFFGGRGMRTCLFYMALTVVAILLFWKVAGQSAWLNTACLCAAGFSIYGPQALVGIAAANLATKRAAASAVGLTGLFGYASTLLSGWGMGFLVQTHGWNAGFACMLAMAMAGTCLFALGWRAHAHGYSQNDE